MCVKVVNGKLIQAGGITPVVTNMDFGLPAEDDSYHNLFGSYKRYNSSEENKIYNDLKQKYPDTTDCSLLSSYEKQLQNELDKHQSTLAGSCDKGCRRVTNRFIKEIKQRLTEIKNMEVANQCVAQKTAADNQQLISNLNNVLDGEKPSDVGSTGDIGAAVSRGLKSLFGGSDAGTDGSGTGTDGSKKPNYLMYAGIGAAVIIGFVIIRKIV